LPLLANSLLLRRRRLLWHAGTSSPYSTARSSAFSRAVAHVVSTVGTAYFSV